MKSSATCVRKICVQGEPKRDLPAALLTGDGSDILKHAARDYGCAVLTKPIKPASLRAWLEARG